MTNREELQLLLERLSDEAANRVKTARLQRSLPMHREPDPRRPNLIIVGKDKEGKPSSWVYGPYLIDRTGTDPDENWADASLFMLMKAWGKDLYSNVPTEIRAMPMEELLDKIDRVLLDLKKGKLTHT